MVSGLPASRIDKKRLLNSSTIFYLAITLGMLFLFGLKDGLLLLNPEWPHLYSVIDIPVLSWEEAYVYLPFANHFSLSTPLPAAPMADPGLSAFTHFPPITLILQGILFKWVFFGNIDAYLLAVHTLLPTAAFWFLFFIYRRYVAQSWSLLLAFFGVTFFQNYSSLGYWIDILGGAGIVEAASLSPVELSRTPIPSLSFFLFIATFYLTTRDRNPPRMKMLLFSLLWGLHLYIYLFNVVAGVLFWFGFLIFSCTLREKAWRPSQIGRLLLENGAVVLLVALPALLNQLLLAGPLDREIWQRMGMIVATAGPITSEWGFVLAYLLPLAAVLFVAWISLADYYELAYHFGPIFVMIAVEIIVLNLHLILGSFFQPHLFSVRIGNFFSRYLYFIPIIYFISQPRKRRFHHSSRISEVLTPVYDWLSSFLVAQRHVIALVGIGLIIVPVAASAVKYANFHAANTAPQMATVNSRFEALAGVGGENALVASEDTAVNLMLPLRSRHETLLVSAFSNYISEEEILERLLLHAHIFNWDEGQFLAFMMPDQSYSGFDSANDFVFSRSVLQNGFGYWLLRHRQEMNGTEMAAYREMVTSRFRSFDVQTAAQTFNLVAVQSSQSINPLLSVSAEIPAGETIIYLLTDDKP